METEQGNVELVRERERKKTLGYTILETPRVFTCTWPTIHTFVRVATQLSQMAGFWAMCEQG